MKLLKLVIVDDEPIILQGLLETYDWEQMGFTVVGSAMNGEKALRVIKDTKPDLVLTDIRMKQITGLMLIEQVKAFNTDVLFLVVSAYRDFEYAQKACEIGAFSYLLKPIDEEKLKSTMKAAYNQCIRKIQMKTEHEHWQKILLEGKDSFLPVLVQKYLENNISEEKLKEVFTLLRGEEEETDHYVAICIDVDISCKIVSPLDYEAERFSLLQHLEQVLKQNYVYWTFDNEKGNRIFLLKTNQCPGSAPVKKLMEETKKEKSSNLISAISREYKGFSGLRKSYDEAVRLFEIASISGAGAFTLSSEADEHIRELPYSTEAETAVINAIRKNEEKQLKNSLVDFVYRLPSKEHLQIQHMHRLMVQAQSVIEETYGTSEEIREGFQKFYQNLNQISAAKLVDVCYTLLSKVIKERRKCIQNQETEYFSDYMSIAIGYIEENLGNEELSVVLVANQIFLNPVYFGRVFKHTHQIPFKQYVQKKRIELAKRLILDGSESITAIGEKVGMPNTSYFSQVFKQYTGKLPSEYKREFEV